MKHPTVLTAVAVSIFLGSCGSESDDTNGDSNDDANGTQASEATLVAFAYQVAQSGQQSAEAYAEPRAAPTATARALPIKATTEDCSLGGTFTITDQENKTITEFTECKQDLGGMTSFHDGKTTIIDQDPVSGFTGTQKVEAEDVTMRFSSGDNFIEQNVDGGHEISFTPGVKQRTDSQITNQLSYQCDGLSNNLTSHYTMTSNMEHVTEGLKYDYEIDMTISDNPTFNGSYRVTTLEPVYYNASANGRPYMGKQEFTLPNSNTVVVEYTEGGAYLDNEFHSWDDLEDANPVLFPEPDTCFELSVNPDPDSDTDTEKMSATINGDSFKFDYPVAVYQSTPDTHILEMIGTKNDGDLVTQLSISLHEEGSVGSYDSDTDELYFSYSEATLLSPDEHYFWSTFNGGGGTVTLTEFSSTRISGTFSTTIHPAPENPDDQQYIIEVTQGEFSVEPFQFE